MQPVRIVLITLILFSISGCAPKCLPIPQRCIVPEVEEPIIDNTYYDNNASIIAKALSNYVKMKEYADKLKESAKVCQ